MNRLRFVCGAAALATLFVCSTAFGSPFTSTQSGNWNDAQTWGGVGVPTSLDDVTISGGFTVTVSDGQMVDTVTLANTSGNNRLLISSGGSLDIGSLGTVLTINPSTDGINSVELDGGTLTVSQGDVSVVGGALAVARIKFSDNGGTFSIAGDLAFSGSAVNAQLQFGTGITPGTLNIGGDLGAGGNLVANDGTIAFNGGGAQTINGPYTFYNLTINKTAGIATMAASHTINGTLDVLNGTLEDGGNQINLNGGGTSNVGIGSSGILKLGAGALTTSFPAPVSGANVNIAAGGTVVYQSSLAQAVNTDVIYSNLIVTNSGAPVIHTMSGLTLNVNQTLTVANNGANITTFNVDDGAVLANGDIAGNGTINVDTGTVEIQGNWGSSTSLNAGTSTITYYGGNPQFVLGATYYNLVIDKFTGTATLGGAATVGGTCNINDGTFHTNGQNFTVNGTFSNSGIFNASASVVVFDGHVTNTNSTPNSLDLDSAIVKLDDLVASGRRRSAGISANGLSGQTVSSASPVTINSLEIANASGSALSGDFTITGSLTLNAGNLIVSGSLFIDVLATVTQNSGWIIGPLTMGMNPSPARRFHVGTPAAYLPVDADSGSAGTLTIEAKEGQYPNRTGDNVLERYWEISAGSATPLETLQFNYNQSDVVTGDETKYRLIRDDSGFTDYGDVAEATNTVTATSVAPYTGAWVIGQRGSLGFAGTLAFTSVNGGVDPNANVPFSVDVESRYDDGTTAANVTNNTSVDITLDTGGGSLLTSTGTINAGTSTATINNLSYDTAETGVVLKASSSSGDVLSEGLSTPINVQSAPAVIIVTNLNDSGPGSLRDAIDTHNLGGCTAPCTIEFTGLSGTINLSTSLPTIVVDDLIINGFTANGASPNTNAFGQPSNANITLAIDGTAGAMVGLEVQANDVEIKGLAVRNFGGGGPGVGVRFGGDSAGSKLHGCYIGTDNAGTTANPNGTGVIVESAEVSIGGTTPAERLVVSGNTNSGINVGATSNTVGIAGAYVGPKANLSGPLPNAIGFYVGATTTSVNIGSGGTGNVISGNSTYGVFLTGSGSTVASNLIGLAGSGNTPMANGAGLMIDTGAANNTIGGNSPADTNVISGNTSNGVVINGDNNTLDVNWIGTSSTGTCGVGNGGHGILVSGTAANNLIGTTFGQTICSNGGDGVSLTTTGLGNVIRKKNIYANTGNAIDIGNDGATANDATDGDTGPNNKQNFPTISEARVSGGSLNVTFSLNSSSGVNTNFFVFDFYRSTAASPTPAVEHIGNSGCLGGNVFSNAIVVLSSASLSVGDYITGTATAYSDAACNTPSEGTSELSPAVVIGQEYHWNNAGGGTWNTPSNWTPVGVPGVNDDAYIDLNGTYTVQINANVSVRSLQHGAASGTQTLQIDNFQTLTLGAASAVFTNGVVSLDGNNLNGAGSLSVTGTFHWGNGTISNGGLAIQAGGALHINGATTHTLNVTLIDIQNGASAYWNGGAINMSNGGAFDNNGLFEVKTDNTINDSFAAGTFDNFATFRKSTTTGTTTFSNVTFNHSGGTLDLQTGVLNLANGIATAPITTSAGTEILIDSNTWSLNAGASMTGSGKFHINGGTLAVNGPSVEIAHILLASGNLGGSGTARTGSGGFWVWNGGTMNGGGTTLVEGGASMQISTAASKNLDNRVFSIQALGAVTIDGTGTINMSNGGTIQNAGTVDNTVDMTFNDTFFDGGITNSFLWKKSGGAGSTTFNNVDFTNSGTLKVLSGTLNTNNVTNTGGIELTPGTLFLDDGTFTLNGASDISGAGLLHLNGGTLTVNTSDVLPNVQLDNGTLNGSGIHDITTLAWTGGGMSGTGSTNIPNLATATISGGNSKSLQRLFSIANGGIATVTGNGTINMANGGAVSNAGLFNITLDMTLNDSFADGGINNTGTFRKSGGTGVTLLNNVDLTNSGTIDVQTGTLNTGNVTNTGNITLTGTLLSDDSTINLNAGSDISGGGLLHINGGTVTANAADTIPNVQLDNGTLNGPGNVTITALTWTGGTMGGTGTTTIPASATATLSGLNSKNLDQRTLSVVNTGTVQMTGSGTLNMSNGGNIANDGLFEITANATVNDSFLDGGIANTRTFRVNVPGTVVLSNVTLNNTGGTALVDVVSGTLDLSDGTSSGAFALASGTTLLIDSHTYTLAAGTTVTGAGTINLTGATLSVTGNVSVPQLAQSGGTIDGAGTLTYTGTASWTNGNMQGGGTTQVGSGGTLTISSASAKNLNNRTLSTVAGGTIDVTGTGTINLSNGGNIANAGNFNVTADMTINDSFLGGNFVNTGTFTRSTATGSLTFANIGFTNNGGLVDLQSGILNVSGDTFTQSSGTLKIWLNGTTPGSGFAQITTNTSASLAGTLQIALTGPYQPVGGNTFRVLAATAHTGDFTQPYTYPALSAGRTFSDAYDASGLLLTVSGQGDLSITKNAPANVLVGAPIAYTLTVNNAGPDAANSVSVTDTLPAGHTGISASGTGWSCNVVSLTVTCTVATLATGNAPAITINATAPNTPQSFQNDATVSSSNDPAPGNNTGSANVTVDPLTADLDVSSITPSSPVAPSTAFTFEKIVKNLGPQTATNVTLTAPIPSTLTYNSAVPDAGTCNFATSTVTCSLGPIAALGEVHVVLNLTTGTTTGTQTVTATAAANETDPDGSNNSITSAVTVTGATLTVTNINDSGTGSLRQALLDAATPGACGPPCTIDFNIGSAPPHEIVLLTDLPDVVGQVTLDATTQPGYAGTPVVEINAGLVNLPNANLNVAGDSAIIRGFALTSGNWGIYVTGNSNTIEDNYIGLDLGGGPDGHNTGIEIEGNNNSIDSNIISDNSVAGVVLANTSNGNTVTGNRIGTDPAGNADMGNGWGVQIAGTASSNTIGGPTAADGNQISGNGTNVYIEGEGSVSIARPVTPNGVGGLVVSNALYNNFIGTDASGNAALDITSDGIIVNDNSFGTLIGGSGTGNVISGNNTGITVTGGSNADTVIEGNLIGVGADGTTAVGNQGAGILINGSVNAYVGGDGGVPGVPNEIANNGGDGVVVLGTTIAGIVNNSIHSNAGLGIDLNDDGATLNDATDNDSGPNGLQNSPNLTAVDLLGGGNARVAYNMDSSATTAGSILVEIFEADAAGEGRTFLTRVCSVGNSFGIGVTFNAPSLAPGDPVVLTATAFSDTACASIGDGTSEFSNVVLAANCTPPAATINASPSVCPNSTGNTASVNAPTATGFSWSISNGTITAGNGTANITYTAGPTGTVILGVIVTNAIGCPNTANANVPISTPPSTTITGPAAVCAGGSVTLDAGTGFASYLWSPGGQNTQQINVSPTGNTTYSVVVTDGNGCPSAPASHLVTVNPNPTVTITGPATTCAGGSVTLDAGTGYATYLWSPGGQTTQQINVTPAGDTTYTVTVTDGNSCSASDSHLVTVTAAPNATITAPANICPGSTGNTANVPFQAGATYNWTVTNGTLTTGAGTNNITFTAGATGNVTLSVTVAQGSCSANGNVNVPINVPPSVTIIGPAATCAGGTVTLDAGPAFASYLWSPGGETTQQINVTPGSTTTYSVIVTDGAGCSATDSHVVTVNPAPTVNITGPNATCNATPVTLDAGAGFATYLWSPGGQTTQQITVTPGADTTYTVTVTDGNSCSASDSHLVTVSANPVAAITAPPSVCASSTNNNASVAVQAGASYLWSITGGTITSGQGTNAIVFSAAASGNVVLGVTVTTGSCTSNGSSTIPIAPPPTVTITGPTTACAGVPFTLDAGAGYTSYQWSTGHTTQSITITQAITSTISVIVTNAGGCSATDSHTVNIVPGPSANIAAPAAVDPDSTGNNASVSASGGSTYAWSITNGTITAGQGTNAIVFTAGSTGTVGLSVTVTGTFCTTSGSANVPINGSVPQAADFTVSKSAASTVQAGSSLTYTIVVSNIGGLGDTVFVSDQLPAGVVVNNVSGGAWSCTPSGTQVNCSGPLAGGASNTILITVTAPQQAGSITNTVTVSATGDADPSNNTASATTLVTARPTVCATTPPSLLSPAANATVTSPVTFSWTAVDGATLYELWLVSGANTFLAGSTSSTSISLAVASGTGQWFVIARLGTGCDPLVSAQRTFTVQQSNNCGQNGAPQIITPSEGATTSAQLTIGWTPVPQAIGYRVWVEVNGTAAQDIGTTNGAINLTVNLPPGAITLYVDALFGGCPATRSAPIHFTVAAPNPCASRGVATPISPANNATINSSSVTFHWNAPANASEARVWASVDGAPAQVLGTTTENELKVVLTRGEVFWWVELLYDGCASTESPRFRFLIPAAQQCGNTKPDPIAPAKNSSVANANVTFQWQGIADAIGYELWLGPVNGTATLIGTTAANVTSLTRLITAGTHEWFIRARVDRCEPRDSQSSRFTYTPPPSCENNQRPVLIAPVDGDAVTSPASFSWHPIPGATRYDLYVIRGNNPPAFVGSTTFEFINNVDLAVGPLRWFVRAFFAAECSPLDSEQRELEIAEAPAACADLTAPVITAPGEISSGVEFLIQWTSSLGATGYQLQLANNPGFNGAELISTNATAHAITRTNGGTTPLAVYARVRAVDSDCTPVAEVSAFGPTSAIFILPPSQGTVPAGEAIVTYTIPLGPELAGQSFTAVPTEAWLTATPASGIVPANGMTIVVTANSAGLGLGANYGGIVVTLNSSSGRVQANPTTVITTPISVNVVTPVTPAPKNTPPPDALIIPAVANADGINSHFQSDVRLSNTSSQLLKYQLTYIPAGDAGITAGRQTTFSVEPGKTIALDDVLKTWFGTGTANAQGSLEIRPLTQTNSSVSSAAIGALANLVSFASSRTFNVTPNGTFGQYIPAVPFANFLGKSADAAKKSVLSLQQISQSSKFRTNLGLLEASGESASLLIKVFGSTGQMLTSFPVNLNGGQQTQLNSFLNQKGITLDDGRIEVEVVSGNGKVTAYASVLDNETSDAVLVTPVTLSDKGETRWVVPGVADLKSGFADWQTDTRVFNAGTDAVDITATFYSQNTATPPVSKTFTLPAGEVKQLDKTLSALFGITGDGGALHFSTATPARLIATARTYNQTSTGTYGQFISAVTPGEAAAVGTRALQLLQLEDSPRFRTNVGFAEVTGKPVSLEVTVTPPDAKFAATTTVHLQANEFRQIGGLLRTALGGKDVYNARVSVRAIAGEGRATAYASVIDLKTNDPTFNPAQ